MLTCTYVHVKELASSASTSRQAEIARAHNDPLSGARGLGERSGRDSLNEVTKEGITVEYEAPAGYVLVHAAPALSDYLALRKLSGLTPKSAEQGAAGLQGSWTACHVVHEATGQTVAMGRVIGDGGWYFHVIDMAVLPEHQRRGLGGLVLTALLDRVREATPPGAFVNLLADPPGRGLYARHGFVETAPHSVGMGLLLP